MQKHIQFIQRRKKRHIFIYLMNENNFNLENAEKNVPFSSIILRNARTQSNDNFDDIESKCYGRP